jgi:hypothetical protein
MKPETMARVRRTLADLREFEAGSNAAEYTDTDVALTMLGDCMALLATIAEEAKA